MCGNRVEELETRVKELEASVEGLTDELVECKVRLRELESAVDDDLAFDAEGADDERDTQETTESHVADSTKQADGNDENNREESEAESESDSDIIVA